MKQNTTTTAKAQASTTTILQELYAIANGFDTSTEKAKEAAAAIRAIEEHAALVAVAEAAHAALFNLENTNGWKMPFHSTTFKGSKISCGGEWVSNNGGFELREALAKLAAIRSQS